ncbi:MAG: sensor domain-containing diguanylate cyclase [Anaerolineaceae bacterium]|nr:sensor domain-containing diguanylate cyclase [Anaerolineaceae bacterium]
MKNMVLLYIAAVSITGIFFTVIVILISRYKQDSGISSISGAASLLFKTHNKGVLILDPDFKIVDFNPAFLASLKLQPEQIKNLHLSDSPIPQTEKIIENCQTSSRQFQISIQNNHLKTYFFIMVHPVLKKEIVQGYIICFEDVTEQKDDVKENRYLATTDPLTETHNRQQFLSLAKHNFALAVRSQQPATVMLIDIDHFKKINDMYGYSSGDELLKEVSKICQNCIREIDVFGRYGKQDFVAYLPETNMDDAMIPAERIRQLVKETHFTISNYTLQTSISIGIACTIPDHNQTLEDLLKNAERALYHAKEHGHNRVHIWKP